MKKIVSMFLAVTLCLGMFSGAALAAEGPSSWAAADVDRAVAEGLVPQTLQEQYTQAATRAEFCALVVAVYESVTGQEIAGRTKFSDTTDVNVEKAAAIGVVSGVGNDAFSPDTGLTREQAATMLARLSTNVGKPLTKQAATFADNGSVSSWALEAVGQIQAAGVMGGVGNNLFVPQGAYTREQSIVTILRLYDMTKAETQPTVPVSISIAPTTASVEVGKSVTLTATVTPEETGVGGVTWTSSSPGIASVSGAGTVTGVAEGTATITAKTSSGAAATCTVTVKKAQLFTVPVVDHEYGPFTVTAHYSSGRYWYSTQVESLVFTKVEKSYEQYRLSISIQGQTDHRYPGVEIYFYDANDRVLDKVLLSGSVASNFNTLITTFVDFDVIENAVRLEFFDSASGTPAVYGSGGGNANTDNTGGSSSTEGTGGSTASSDTGYYDSFSDVPDFGALVGLEPVAVVDADTTISYTYDIYDLVYPDDPITDYRALLKRCGFMSMVSSYGDPTHYGYQNSTTTVSVFVHQRALGEHHVSIMIGSRSK